MIVQPSQDVSVSNESVEAWLRQARDGHNDALGQLLELLRPYLLSVAAAQLGGDMRGKAGVSDVVQETFVRAQQGFHGFHGQTRQELLAWLRTILLNNIVSVQRRYTADKRDVNREVSLNRSHATAAGAGLLKSGGASPSSLCARNEEAVTVLRALAVLPEDYRQVLQLRDWEGMSWEQIGDQIGRTPEAARKLWARALDRLRRELEHLA